MAQVRPASEISRKDQSRVRVNSRLTCTSDWELEQVKDERAGRLSGDSSSLKARRENCNSEKAYRTPSGKMSKEWRAPHHRYAYLEKERLDDERKMTKPGDILGKNSKLENADDILLQFKTKRIDLVERDWCNTRKEVKTSCTRKCLNGYEISVDLFNPRKFNGIGGEEKVARRDGAKGKVCVRFEKRFNSAPKERTHRTHDETINANKIRLYPFCETSWRKGQLNNEYFFTKNLKQTAVRPVDFGNSRGFESVGDKGTVADHLMVSSVQLTPKKAIERTQKSRPVGATDAEEDGSQMNVMQVLCSPKTPKEGKGLDEMKESSSGELANIIMMHSKSLRETFILLARITASSMMLTSKQVLRLIENGDLNIGKFLIIKKLLLTVHPYQFASIAGEESKHGKEIVSLLFAVLEFIDRCEMIVKRGKGSSSLEACGNMHSEVDCTKRGVIVGKMPAISVMGYSRKNGLYRSDRVESSNRKKSKVELINGKKIRSKKGELQRSSRFTAVQLSSYFKLPFRTIFY